VDDGDEQGGEALDGCEWHELPIPDVCRSVAIGGKDGRDMLVPSRSARDPELTPMVLAGR
jgi:hypothetical protein